MRVNFRGEELRLKPLSDREYGEAERLARMGGVSLDVCPTCGAKETDIPGSGGVKEFRNGIYRFRGEDHFCDCQAQMALRSRYLLANIGDQYMRLDWDDFDGSDDAAHWVPYYIEKWKSFLVNGMGLEFGGADLGVGKTFAATTIGKELIKRGQRVFFIPFVNMVSAFETDGGEVLEKRMRETTFLILDEILPAKSERQRDFYATKLEALIRHRTNFNLPTITTTNMLDAELHSEYPRTYSLLQAKQIRVNMSGKDMRSTQIRVENLELIENTEVRPIT